MAARGGSRAKCAAAQNGGSRGSANTSSSAAWVRAARAWSISGCARTGPEPYAVKLLHGPVGDDEAGVPARGRAGQAGGPVLHRPGDGRRAGRGRPYIVSEYVDGPSLQREVAVSGPREGGGAGTAGHRHGHRAGGDPPGGDRAPRLQAAERAARPGRAEGHRLRAGQGAGRGGHAERARRRARPPTWRPSRSTGAEHQAGGGRLLLGRHDVLRRQRAGAVRAGFDRGRAAPHPTAPPELGRLDGLLGSWSTECLAKDPRNRPTSRELLLALLDDDDGRWAGLRSPSSPSMRGHDRAARPEHPRRALPALPACTARKVGLVRQVRPVRRVRRIRPSARSAWSVRSAEFARSGESNEPRTYPGRAATRASVAVSGALLVSAAVLVGVLVPALSGDGGVVGDGQTLPVVETSAEAETTPPTDRATRPARPSQRAEGPSALLPPPAVPATSPGTGTGVGVRARARRFGSF